MTAGGGTWPEAVEIPKGVAADVTHGAPTFDVRRGGGHWTFNGVIISTATHVGSWDSRNKVRSTPPMGTNAKKRLVEDGISQLQEGASPAASYPEVILSGTQPPRTWNSRDIPSRG